MSIELFLCIYSVSFAGVGGYFWDLSFDFSFPVSFQVLLIFLKDWHLQCWKFVSSYVFSYSLYSLSVLSLWKSDYICSWLSHCTWIISSLPYFMSPCLTLCCIVNNFFLIFLTFIYFLRQHKQGRGRERGRHRIRSSSRLWAVSTDRDARL